MPENIKENQQTVLGLDIDQTTVKLVKVLLSSESTTLQAYSIVTHGGAVQESILKACNQLNVSDSEVNISLPGVATAVRRLQMPDMTELEIPKALQWKLKNLIPFPVDDAIINHVILKKTDDKGVKKIDLMAIAVQKEALATEQSLLSGIGLKVGVATVPALAVWEIVKKSTQIEANQNIVVIDIGANAASINFFKDNVLCLTRDISVAGDHITKSMVGLVIADEWQLNLTYEQAETIKTKYGIPDENSPDKTDTGIPLSQIFSIMKPTLRRLANEINRSFDYFKEQFQAEKIDRVILAGGSSQTINLKEFLSENIGTPVELLNPLTNIKIASELEKDRAQLDLDAARLTLALGLALSPQTGLNIIQSKKQKDKAGKLPGVSLNLQALHLDKLIPANIMQGPNVIYLAGGLVLAGILFIGLTVNLSMDGQKSYWNKQLEQKNIELEDLRSVKDRRELLERIMREETRVKEILGALTATLPAETSLKALSYSNDGKQMLIEGQCFDLVEVGNTLKNIESSPDFSQTTLMEARKIEVKSTDPLMTQSSMINFKASFVVDK
jgi:type IV pilus assembly protein PilM